MRVEQAAGFLTVFGGILMRSWDGYYGAIMFARGCQMNGASFAVHYTHPRKH